MDMAWTASKLQLHFLFQVVVGDAVVLPGNYRMHASTFRWLGKASRGLAALKLVTSVWNLQVSCFFSLTSTADRFFIGEVWAGRPFKPSSLIFSVCARVCGMSMATLTAAIGSDQNLERS